VTTLPFNSGATTLPRTGSDGIAGTVFWAVLVLLFGRAALLLSRPGVSTTPKRR
jgi:hypothetical protein